MTPRKIAAAEEVARSLSGVGNVKLSEVEALYTLAVAWVEQKEARPKAKAPKGKALGEAVRAAREAAGMTVVELAATVGISRQAVGDIEKGKAADPKFSVVRRLAAALGVGLEDLGG